MPDRIFIGVAWPYANSSLHLGHVAGAYLPADIFARYNRLKGNHVLMVSGSDQHGTPITVRAEEEKTTPQAIVDHYQPEFLECFRKLGIGFDLFTHTRTKNHEETVHEIFSTLLKKDYIYKKTMSLPYSTVSKRFLPDRYVEGTCPYCAYQNARGDQCDNCGKTLDPKDLKNIRSKIAGDVPEFRDTEHFFLKLSAFEGPLAKWVGKQAHWRGNVKNFTANYLRDGLLDRAITRDLEWGVPIPVPGYENKRIYVWFEAVIGYLSASKEWAASQGKPDAWKDYWYGDVKSYYFIGKDNIPFHTIVWPAQLLAFDTKLKLPFDVPANEFLNLEGMKFSKSRNWAVWLKDFQERFDPDPLRYVLSINMPETSDTDFTWKEFLRRNNDELVATYGNLVNRVLSFTYRSFNGHLPEVDPAKITDSSKALIAQAERTFDEVGQYLSQCKFKDGIRTAMGLARDANKYLEKQSPWKSIKVDKQAAANALWTGAQVISCLKTVLCPYMPFTSARVHEYLGFPNTIESAGWTFQRPASGQKLNQPAALFVKLDEEAVAKEMTTAKS